MLGDGQQQLGHLHGCIRWRSLCPAREEDKGEARFRCGSAGARLKLNKKRETHTQKNPETRHAADASERAPLTTARD